MRTFALILALLCLPFGAEAAVNEGQSFTLDQPGRVVFGVGASWVNRDLLAGVPYVCGLAVFGDPAKGQLKTCHLPVPEGHQMRVPGGLVWYGSGSRFTVKQLDAGTYYCANGTFGDPAPGTKKQCYATGMLDSIDCYPAQLGGNGSRAAWGVSLSPVSAWAGWWCAGRVQIVACAGASCRPDLARMVINTTGDILNKTLVGARTDDIGSTAMRAVWEPHWDEIVATRP
jgi:hypothetical protein